MSQLKKLGQAAAEALANKGAKAAAKLQHVEADPQAFFKAVEGVRASDNPMFRANITQYSPEDYTKFKTYLSPDGKSGYAIKPDGELISVFSTEKGRGELILDDAVERGAQKLDAFDINGKLPKLYSKYFDETERFKFDPKQAPADWDAAALGQPDVVMMKLNPEKVKATQNPPLVNKEIAEQGLAAIKKSNMASVGQSKFSKALELLGKPQQYASDKLAEAAGIEKGESSEQNFANVADKAVNAFVPENSEYLGPALKAGAVAAAEVFGDPLNVIPLGKVAKVAGKAIKGLPEMKALGTLAETGNKLKAEIASSGVQKMTKAQKLEELANIFKKQEAAKEGAALDYAKMRQEKLQKSGGTLDYSSMKPEKVQKPEAEPLDYTKLLSEYRNKNK